MPHAQLNSVVPQCCSCGHNRGYYIVRRLLYVFSSLSEKCTRSVALVATPDDAEHNQMQTKLISQMLACFA